MRRLRMLLCPLLLLGLLPQTARAEQDDGVRAVVSVDPTGGALVGQKVRLYVKLMTDSYFRAAPELPEIDLRQAIVRQESQMAVNGSEQVDGETFATQTWEFAVYPQRPGTYAVPAFDVTVTVADDDARPLQVIRRTKPLTFTVRRPPGLDGDEVVVATPRLTLTASAPPDTASLRVGDAYERTLVRTVEDAPAMLLPPLPPVELPGVRAYPAEPRVIDKTNRGSLTGTRSETTTFVFQRAGSYTLPEIRVPWWNLRTGTLEEAVLEAVSLEVAPNPELPTRSGTADGEVGEPEGRATTDASAWWRIVLWTLAALVMLRLSRRRVVPALRERRARAQAARAASEPAAFARFEAACADADPRAARRRLQDWLAVRPGTAGDETPTSFAARLADADLEAALTDLDARTYGASPPTTPWDGARLLRAVERVRIPAPPVPSSAALYAWGSLNPPGAPGARQESS